MSRDLALVVLAGGEGTRIGGAKPLRSLGGRLLIDRALEQARRWSSTIAVAVREESQVGPVHATLIGDDPEVEGPLGGLVSGLSFARSAGSEFLLTIPTDMPFLPGNLPEKLHGAIADYGSALASSGGHLHPVCGLWRSSSLEKLPAYLASGRRSLKGFAELIGCAQVEWPVAPTDPFFNVNSAEDLVEAEKRLER
jgi:molybdopterin-guanine dinucleotide biosynthesis protein A